MDFGKLNETTESNRPRTLENIIGPDGETVLDGVSIKLLGAQSSAGQAATAKYRQKMTLKAMQEENLDSMTKKGTDKLVACTVDWSGIEMDGKEYKCTPANVRALYDDAGYSWLRNQVLAFVENPANFFNPADKS